MTKSNARQLLGLLSPVVGLIGLVCIMPHISAGAIMRDSELILTENNKTTVLPMLTDCDGDACGQVTVTWDENRQQYKVQNNSTDRWVRVDAANLGATATICVAAGKTEYLPLKSIVGAYRANYERTCANQE